MQSLANPLSSARKGGNVMLVGLFRKLSLILAFLLALVFPSFTKTPKSQQAAQEPSPNAAPVEAKNDYVSSATCASCHEAQTMQFATNPHQILNMKEDKGWKDRACEACHGPGQTHVDAGDGSHVVLLKSSSTNAEINKVCLSCHADSNTQAGGPASLHRKENLACTECHSIHEPKQKQHLLTASVDRVCTACHKDVLAAFYKPFHHRLLEGAIHCVDCHQPHSGLMPKMAKLSFGNESPCVKCHSDKRGPFAFEHPVIRLEGCMGCHEPHGSINSKMLIRTQLSLMCLECHTFSPGILASQPPSFHDLRSARFRNCTTCHVKIHGSNVDRFLMH